ncbi:hypothetical protein NEOLEDRAFT_757032 [Neolentinus lepideus HHB14362 ss-1]|uniref:RNA polymerase II elongation factor ELL N-terminal domain-containing protein n=1 Tax=Neolentinus lepideus HHB14362 ss-1 TaxID=1314782 RepID=A0A165PRA1_9AGAM|nr:hypothetical protein NEOLEDRAFT_757032 [Neolentinus lepideus HHB14362 ss-1]
MPLPSDVRLSLQGPARPDDAVQSKPKKVMLVRMTAETLEALSDHPNNPRMDFSFAPGNTGIYIGDTFFPMRAHQETSPSELYLRAATAAKPNAPLKLYGNIVGKFSVERELDKVAEQVRDRAAAAEKQRTGRKAVLLKDIPTTTANGKKRKPAPPAKKPGAAAARAPGVGAQARVASPALKVSSQRMEETRHRMIHCVAVQPRTQEEVVKLVGGPNATDADKQMMRDMLREIAMEMPRLNKQSTRDPPTWELKNTTYREVRPYEWGRLTENERLSIARKARVAFRDLEIPASDPVWAHVMQPPTSSTVSTSTPPVMTSTAGAGKPAPKRPATKKSAAKPKEAARIAKQEIQAKDEGSRHPLPPKPKVSPNPTPAPARKAPGSGFKMVSPAPPPKGESPSVTVKAAGPVDARADRRREEPAPSGSARPAPPIPPPTTKIKEEKKPTPAGRKAVDKGKAREPDVKKEEGTLKRKKAPLPKEEDEEEGRGSENNENGNETGSESERGKEKDTNESGSGSGKEKERENVIERKRERGANENAIARGSASVEGMHHRDLKRKLKERNSAPPCPAPTRDPRDPLSSPTVPASPAAAHPSTPPPKTKTSRHPGSAMPSVKSPPRPQAPSRVRPRARSRVIATVCASGTARTTRSTSARTRTRTRNRTASRRCSVRWTRAGTRL